MYHDHFAVVKLLCENIPNLDLAFAGKLPESSGLANPSEIILTESMVLETPKKLPTFES